MIDSNSNDYDQVLKLGLKVFHWFSTSIKLIDIDVQLLLDQSGGEQTLQAPGTGHRRRLPAITFTEKEEIRRRHHKQTAQRHYGHPARTQRSRRSAQRLVSASYPSWKVNYN